MTIVAAADGSALGNPGPAGWAWYVDDEHWAAGGWPHGTNNQGELTAVLDLFRSTADSGEDLHVLCDSQYVINTITTWMPGWKRKGWRKRDGSPVLNLETIQALDREIVGRTYRFEWVKGHAGHPLNEAADVRARAAATAFSRREAVDGGPGWAEASDRRTVGRGETSQVLGVKGSETGPDGMTPRPEREPVPRHPELFDLDDDPASDRADVADVVAAERRLLDPAVRADPGALRALLSPDFAEIGASGRRFDLASITALLSSVPDTDGGLEVLSADRVSDDVMLIVWRHPADRPSLRSSLWVRDGGRWRLRFAQGTPES